MFWRRNLSPLSPHLLRERRHLGLLLQFLLTFLFEAFHGSDEELLPLKKLQEHALWLKKAFPEEQEALVQFESSFSSLLSSQQERLCFHNLYLALEPFLKQCQEDENLILFLLKNRSTIDQITKPSHLQHFLRTLYPEGLEILGEKICDRYHQRGFSSQISECKLLLSELI